MTLFASLAAPANEPLADGAAKWDGPVLEIHTNRLALSDWGPANPVALSDLGPLDGFYRYTQLQGHLVQEGLYLHKVPDFWCEGSDFPYRKKASTKEVFFVDEFSITRFLGGYPPHWKHNGRESPTNDLAYVDEKGQVRYRLHLVKERLRPYIENGYTRFIIGIENVPWALARDPSKVGPYGITEPPRDWREWHAFIKAVCEEMRRVYPDDVCRNLKFKIGNEYNQKKSFTGTHEEYLMLYDWSAAAIRSVFPEAPIMPGEIGGAASGPDNSVDYPRLYEHLIRGTNYAGLPHPSPVSVLARSSHSFPMRQDLSPRERVQFSFDSLREVLEGKPETFVKGLSLEYHQFGVLGSRFTESGHPVDARAASWHFQVLFRSKAAACLDQCWSWQKSERVEFNRKSETHLLNGIGWLYMILDHLQGDRICLPGVFQSPCSADEATAVAFINERRMTLILASWSRDPDSKRALPVRVDLPRHILPFELQLAKARMVSFTDAANAYREIRRDLESEGNLRPEFMAHPDALGTIRKMANDYLKAKTMVRRNCDRYQRIQQQSLVLKPIPEGTVSLTAWPRVPHRSISAGLLPNEVRVLVFPE